MGRKPILFYDPAKKAYLGDGVYVTGWYDGIVLTTENGLKATNTIYLDFDVLEALRHYLRTKGTPA